MLLLLQAHPECESISSNNSEILSAQEAARDSVRALLSLREALEHTLGPSPLAAINIQPNSYHSYLLHLRDCRPKLRIDHPQASSREIEKIVADEWTRMSAEKRAPIIERALKVRQQKLEQEAEAAADSGRPATMRKSGRNRPPCAVCLEMDKRDAVICGTCAQPTHLMCMFPPWESAPDEWTCLSCRAVVPPPLNQTRPVVGEKIEVEVAEPEEKGSDKIWKKAVVSELRPCKRFICCINEEEDFLEEYGMEDESIEWRRLEHVHVAHREAIAKAEAAAAGVAIDKAEVSALLAIDSEAPESPWLKHIEDLYGDGYCILEQGIDEEQVRACFDVVSEGYKRYMHSVKTLDLQEKLQDVGFMEIKMRSAGRYDLQLPELSGDAFAFLLHHAPWMPLVKAALGADSELVHFGCMLSFPGSATQPWHMDGPHIRHGGSASFTAPPHSLNVFVPLVDLTSANGPTEFVPTSQTDYDIKAPSRIPTVKAGSALIFDYRLKHRGLGNQSSEERPLLYITYAR